MTTNSTPLTRTRLVNQTLWIEIDNPPVNFLTADLCRELYRHFRAAETDIAIRAIVLTGGLPDCYIFHFSIPELQAISRDNRRLALDRIAATSAGSRLIEWSAGASLWLMSKSAWYEERVLALAARFRASCSTLYLWLQMMAAYRAIERSSKITIAAINGTCNGGGTEMAACFDFRFMVEDGGFTLGQPEVMVGIIAGGGGSQRWPRLIGKAKALEFMLCCDQWTPQAAKRDGMITDHFPKQEFRVRVQAFADKLSQRSSVAVAENKRAIRRGLETGLNHALAIEMASTVRCFADPATQGTMAAYAALLDEHVVNSPKPAPIAKIMEFLEDNELPVAGKKP